MTLTHLQGDLFEVEKFPGSYTAHACNSLGHWGQGFARALRDHYPRDYLQYRKYCETHGRKAVGTALITHSGIICLITSENYGANKSRPDVITANTFKALLHLEKQLPQGAIVYSNTFNSGLFQVPWAITEFFLLHFLYRRTDINWFVVRLEAN